MHHIQTKILNKLLYAESLTYAAMRPDGVESNHFAYHLDQLLRSKLIEKNDRQYSLSPEGLAFVDRLSQKNMAPRLQPHILSIIDLTNNEGQTLLYERKFQPYIHRLGFPLGKTHYEESVAEAAARELQEKTGLEGVDLTHRGMVYMTISRHGFTISKILGHVFQGKSEEKVMQTSPKRGSCVWADPANYRADELMPGFMEIKTLLATQPGLFFKELTVELTEHQT